MVDVIASEMPVLRIQVQSAAESGADLLAVFEVLRGSGSPRKVAAEPTSRLGLPDIIRSQRDVIEEDLQIPQDLLRQIVAALSDVATPRDAVYLLDLPAPHAYLRLLSPGSDCSPATSLYHL